jgi:hypothetical protein
MGKLIEDGIREKLTGDPQKNALDLVAFMRENEFSFDAFDMGSETGWNPTYKGKGFGCVQIGNDNTLGFWLGLDWNFDDTGKLAQHVDDDLKEFAWAHVVVCPQEKYCKPPYCQPNDEHPGSRNRWQIFGKEYESTCHAPLAFFNPDAKAVENLKKLLYMTK